MSRWEQHNLADPLIPDQKRLGLLRQPVQAQSVQPQSVQPQPVQSAFQPTNVMDVSVSNMPSARQQRLDKYANTLTNMSLFATLATGKSIRDYGAAFRTQPTGQKDKVQDKVYSNIGALLQKARAAGVDLSDQRKVYELGTQAGITDPRYMKVLLDAAKNSRAPARETDFMSFYDKGGNESRYIKGTQGYSDAVKNKNLTTNKPTAYDLGTLWNAEGEPRTYKNRQQELAAREVGFNRTSPPKAGSDQKSITQDGVVYFLDPITDKYVPAIGPKNIDYSKDYIPVTEDEKDLAGNDGGLIYPQGVKLSPGGLQKRVDTWRKNTGADNSDKKPLTEIEYYKDQVERVFIGLAQNNTVGDIGAINALQRMIDPGVSVREGDVALQEMATPWIEYISLWKAKAQGKGRFRPEERKKMANLARQMAEYVRTSRVKELDYLVLLMKADSPQLSVKRVFGEDRLEELRNPFELTDISEATEKPREEETDQPTGSTLEFQFEATEEQLDFFTPGTKVKLPDGRIVEIE